MSAKRFSVEDKSVSAHRNEINPWQGKVLQLLQKSPHTVEEIREAVGGTEFGVNQALDHIKERLGVTISES